MGEPKWPDCYWKMSKGETYTVVTKMYKAVRRSGIVNNHGAKEL